MNKRYFTEISASEACMIYGGENAYIARLAKKFGHFLGRATAHTFDLIEDAFFSHGDRVADGYYYAM